MSLKLYTDHHVPRAITMGLRLRQQDVSIGLCIQDLEMIAEAGTEADVLNRVIYLPL